MSKPSHDNGVILAGIREARHCYVAVTNGLDLEDTTLCCELIKGVVDRFEQNEYLRGLSRGAPCGKANDIGEHDGRAWKELGNWLGRKLRLRHAVVVLFVADEAF